MGGGGSSYTHWSGERLTGALRKQSEKASAEFDVELAGKFSELLTSFNSRDAELVQSRIDDAKEALQGELRGSIDQRFGGSVAKHTYVDGLSDVDSLLILDADKFEGSTPKRVLRRMETILKQQLPREVQVTQGNMAMTLNYPDGMAIQLLPAFRTHAGIRIPRSDGKAWSEINTDAFQKHLTQRNDECAGKLIPTIKLAKAVIANFPEKYRLTGYHVESLATLAFRGYDGPKTTSAMLPYFFERAKDLVNSPVRDKTGQSEHVDEYLGAEDSEPRRSVSHLLGRCAKRMRNASGAKSKAQWDSIFFAED